MKKTVTTIAWKFAMSVTLLLFTLIISFFLWYLYALYISPETSYGSPMHTLCTQGGYDSYECKSTALSTMMKQMQETYPKAFFFSLFLSAVSYLMYFRKHPKLFMIITGVITAFIITGMIVSDSLFSGINPK